MQNSELKNELLGAHKEVSAKELKDYLNGNLSNSRSRAVEAKLNSSDFSSDAADGIKTYGTVASATAVSHSYASSTLNVPLLLIFSSLSIAIVGVWAFMCFSTEDGISTGNDLPKATPELTELTPPAEDKKAHFLEEELNEKQKKTEKNLQNINTPEAPEANKINAQESAPVLFSLETENEIFTLNPLEKKKGKLFQISEKATLKTQSARIRHYRNYKLVDQGIGIGESLLHPVLKGTPAFKETIIINPKYPDWVPADSIYRISINEGLDWVISKDYAKAKMRFKRLLENTSKDLSSSFYLGYTYYLDGKYEQALTYLQMAQIHVIQTFDHDARFLEIKCYLNLGRDEDALKEALYLKNADSFYAEKAMELVE